MSNSRNTSMIGNCEVSPLIYSKSFNQFGNSSSFKKLVNYSSENKTKSNSSLLKDTFFSSNNNINCGFLTPYCMNEFFPLSKISSFDHNAHSISNTITKAESYPSIKFTSKLFSYKKKKVQKVIYNETNSKIKRNFPLKRIKIFLNQISINGHKLENFPFCSVEKEDVYLLENLFVKKHYFKFIDNSFIDINSSFLLDENLELPTNILAYNNLYFFPEETNAKNIINNFYSEIRNLLMLIEKNYLHKKNKIFNEKNLLKLEILIRNCNLFTDFLIKRQKKKNFASLKNKKEKKKIKTIIFKNVKIFDKSSKIFECEFCQKTFNNGQALGGHISQIHPHQSIKYKKKIEVRNKRKDKRELIMSCKKQILLKYGYNYDQIKASNNNKYIKKYIDIHRAEYKELIKKKKKNNLFTNTLSIQ